MFVEVGNDVTKVLLFFAFSLFICSMIYKWFKERNYPPGPLGYPFIGYTSLRKRPHEAIVKLSKKYGDIFSFYIGPTLQIAICDYHLAKELLTQPQMLSRPPHAFDFLMGKGGMGGLNGEEWMEQRRFAMYTMRNLGLGKGLWETLIQEKAADFVEEIASWKGKPVCIEEPIAICQAANEVALIFGRHLDKETDAENIELIRQATRELSTNFSSVDIHINVPWLAGLMEKFPVFPKYNRFISFLRKFENIFRKEVEARMKSEESLAKDDFIGCYLREMKKREMDSKPNFFTLETLLGNMFILFVGGNDSTMAGVSWLLLLMASHPYIQKKVHQEIDDTIGRDGIIYYEDKAKLPYVIAAVTEMTRWASINPIYPPRYVEETFEFKGYTIPQGSHVIVNIGGIMRDPKYFKDPNEFKPERFLSEDGEKLIKLDGYAPFSFGKRNCPGEGVAIMTIFLFFVFIMQKFRVTMPPGMKADLEPADGGVSFPKSQKMCFLER